MSLAPTTGHQAVAMHLGAWLDAAQARGHGQVFAAPTAVVLAPDTVVQPDLLFVRGDGRAIITDANIQGPPDIIVEILAPVTRDRDFSAKRQLYARFGVPHHWIVDPATATVARFTLNQLTCYAGPEIAGKDDWLDLPFTPAQAVAVSTLFS